MVGSGIASAIRKPPGPRGSWWKQGRAGYLSPRDLCTHNIQYRRQVPFDVCNPERERERERKGKYRMANAMPERSTRQGRAIWAFLPCPIASGFARGLRALGAMSVLSRWSRQTECSPSLSPEGPPGSLGRAGLDLWDFGKVSLVILTTGRASEVSGDGPSRADRRRRGVQTRD